MDVIEDTFFGTQCSRASVRRIAHYLDAYLEPLYRDTRRGTEGMVTGRYSSLSERLDACMATINGTWSGNVIWIPYAEVSVLTIPFFSDFLRGHPPLPEGPRAEYIRHLLSYPWLWNIDAALQAMVMCAFDLLTSAAVRCVENDERGLLARLDLFDVTFAQGIPIGGLTRKRDLILIFHPLS